MFLPPKQLLHYVSIRNCGRGYCYGIHSMCYKSWLEVCKGMLPVKAFATANLPYGSKRCDSSANCHNVEVNPGTFMC